MTAKWTREQAWEWYDRQPWIMGCNFIPSGCIGGTQIWQEYDSDAVFHGIDRELGIAADTGMNSVRMVMPFYVWKHQNAGFKQRLDRFLTMADGRGISLMPVLFDDCCAPKKYSGEPRFGPQPEPVPGHHGGFPPHPPDPENAVGWIRGDDPDTWPDLEHFVTDLVGTFAQDTRIVLWDIWNEPGNSGRGTRSQALMEKAFEWARSTGPIQPLSAGPWEFPGRYFADTDTLSPIEKRAIELSDVLTYHYYGNLDRSVRLIAELKKYGLPMLITEWLHRPFENHIADLLPVFQREKIGCYIWGLVNGKTQTHEPWASIRSMPDINLDVWQHDIYRGDGTPYDPAEIALFRELGPERG